MKIRGSRRLVKRLGLALAVATIVAPAAQAMPLDMPPRALDSIQPRLYADDIRVATPVLSIRERRYADDIRAATPVPSIRERRYADDLRAPVSNSPVSTEPRGWAPINTQARPVVPAPQTHVVSADSSRFDWGDASIGAFAAFGLMLVGGCALLAARSTRRSRLAAV